MSDACHTDDVGLRYPALDGVSVLFGAALVVLAAEGIERDSHGIDLVHEWPRIAVS